MSFHPFHTLEETRELVSRLHASASPIVHPQRVLDLAGEERPALGRANAWLADHVVGIAGTMAFFYFLLALISAWAFWQSALDGDRGFDPFPYAFLFFMLGGIMQSLFVPTSLTAANRAAERARIKSETDHRALEHLYQVNEEQLRLLHELAAALLPPAAPAGGAPPSVEPERQG